MIKNHKNIVKLLLAKSERKIDPIGLTNGEANIIHAGLKHENFGNTNNFNSNTTHDFSKSDKEISNINTGSGTNPGNSSRDANDINEVFKKPLNPANFGKYNPLHWSAYKGNILITSILIKYGYKAIEIDNYGNTALHQAAASNNIELFKLFMGLGIDLEVKNARNHMAIDLTSNKEIKELITKTLEIKSCQICSKPFDFFTKRFVCYINSETVCSSCCHQEFFYETVVSEEKDIFECRCKNCFKYILDAENNLKGAIKSNSLEEIYAVVNFVKINNIKICPKLGKNAEFEIDRLEREKNIITHLDNLKVVDNHKTIEKSVYLLEEMLKDAQDNSIPLDNSVVEKAHLEKQRLLAEKELRRALNNFAVEDSSIQNLEIITEKVSNAKTYNVESKYVEQGEELMKKMQLNISAKDVLELLCSYPIRAEYPRPEDNDPKKKSKKYYLKIFVLYIINKNFINQIKFNLIFRGG